MYEIEELPRFTRAMDELNESYPRVKRAVRAAIKVLSIRPSEIFATVVIGREDWRAFKLDAAPGVPAMNVFYRVDEAQNKVYIIRADLCEEEPEEGNKTEA